MPYPAEVQAAFSIHPRLDALWRSVRPLAATDDLAHDALHVLRVCRWALVLAPEAEASAELCAAAALLHDLVNLPKDDPERAAASAYSATASAPLLSAAGYTAAETETIQAAIAAGSWSGGKAPPSAVALVLQEADRLDAMGAIGIARTFCCAQRMARGHSQLYDPADPRAQERSLDDRHFAVDHFPRKLLALGATLRLPSARAEGARRHARLERFLEDLFQELGDDREPAVNPGCANADDQG